MGAACCKAAVKPIAMSGQSYHTSRRDTTNHPATHIHNAASFILSASPLLALLTTYSGTAIHPMHETLPIVSRIWVDSRGRRHLMRTVLYKYNINNLILNAATVMATHSTMDVDVLKEQMQMLSRLKSNSVSTRQSVGKTNGAVGVASRTESPRASVGWMSHRRRSKLWAVCACRPYLCAVVSEMRHSARSATRPPD